MYQRSTVGGASVPAIYKTVGWKRGELWLCMNIFSGEPQLWFWCHVRSLKLFQATQKKYGGGGGGGLPKKRKRTATRPKLLLFETKPSAKARSSLPGIQALLEGPAGPQHVPQQRPTRLPQGQSAWRHQFLRPPFWAWLPFFWGDPTELPSHPLTSKTVSGLVKTYALKANPRGWLGTTKPSAWFPGVFPFKQRFPILRPR